MGRGSRGLPSRGHDEQAIPNDPRDPDTPAAGRYISVYRDSTAGPGAPSSIRIWWYEDADKMREMVRENSNKLPAAFQKVITDEDVA